MLGSSSCTASLSEESNAGGEGESHDTLAPVICLYLHACNADTHVHNALAAQRGNAGARGTCLDHRESSERGGRADSLPELSNEDAKGPSVESISWNF